MSNTENESVHNAAIIIISSLSGFLSKANEAKVFAIYERMI
jgi:hypothetical protein